MTLVTSSWKKLAGRAVAPKVAVITFAELCWQFATGTEAGSAKAHEVIEFTLIDAGKVICIRPLAGTDVCKFALKFRVDTELIVLGVTPA